MEETVEVNSAALAAKVCQAILHLNFLLCGIGFADNPDDTTSSEQRSALYFYWENAKR
jgi:hypothetical protein